MSPRSRQQGMTLVVALVMLVVLTLLVVSAVRFGNINLKISGNMQAETEAQAAAQVALEQAVDVINAAPNISAIPKGDVTVSTGGISYTVSVSKPACLFTKNIPTIKLEPTDPKDEVCFESQDPGSDSLITAANALTRNSTACKEQQWDVQTAVNDGASGANASLLQGVSLRVGAEVVCP